MKCTFCGCHVRKEFEDQKAAICEECFDKVPVVNFIAHPDFNHILDLISHRLSENNKKIGL